MSGEPRGARAGQGELVNGVCTLAAIIFLRCLVSVVILRLPCCREGIYGVVVNVYGQLAKRHVDAVAGPKI